MNRCSGDRLRCLFRLALLSVLPLAPLALAQTTSPIKSMTPAPQPQPVLDRIRTSHALVCGVSREEEDYSRASDHGNRAAFDIDLCTAVAVAVLGPGAKLIVKGFPDEPATLKALFAGEVDLAASASPTVANTARGLLFTSPSFYDGQGFLVPVKSAVKTPLDLAGKKVCFLTGSFAEAGLHSYASQHGISYIWYPFSEAGEMEAAFFTGNCDAISGDVSSLANIRTIDPRRAHEFVVLPQLIRQDPLAAATLASDPRFAAVANWTLQTLVAAEEFGVTQANVQAQLSSKLTEVQQILGQPYGTGTALGLDPHWGAHVIEAVGNYGEIFDRDLGADSALQLDRGENRLWTDGGVLYPIQPNDH